MRSSRVSGQAQLDAARPRSGQRSTVYGLEGGRHPLWEVAGARRPRHEGGRVEDPDIMDFEPWEIGMIGRNVHSFIAIH